MELISATDSLVAVSLHTNIERVARIQILTGTEADKPAEVAVTVRSPF